MGAGLYNIGIPDKAYHAVRDALKPENYLIIAHGTADEVAKAKSILDTTGAAQIAAHSGLLAT